MSARKKRTQPNRYVDVAKLDAHAAKQQAETARAREAFAREATRRGERKR